MKLQRMSDDYTPSTEDVRSDATHLMDADDFDRWLEQVKAEARADVLSRPLPTREEIADELSGWPIGNGYYATIVSIDEARGMADAVLELLKGQDR